MRLLGARLPLQALPWLLGVVLALSGCQPSAPPNPGVRRVLPGQSIQAVLDQAHPGETVLLSRGTWAENLRIEKSLTLRGEGPEATVLSAAQPGPPVIWVGGDAEVRLEGLTLRAGRGGYVSPLLSSAGVFAQDKARVVLQGVKIQAHAASGVFARDEAQLLLVDGEISGNVRYGLELIGRARVVAQSTRIVQNKTGGVWLAEEARLEGEALEVRENGGMGLWVRDSAYLKLFASRLEANAKNAVYVQDEAQALLLGTHVAQHEESAVYGTDQARIWAYGSSFEGNWNGLELAGGQLYLERCFVRASRWDAIRAQRGTLEVWASLLEGGRGAGLSLTGTARAQIRDTEIQGFAVAGVSGFSLHPAQGEGNRMSRNGVDLIGNVDPRLRLPLAPAERAHVRLAGPGEDLQRVVDSLLPGGVLELGPGLYPAGITVAKPLEIRGEGAALVGKAEAPVLSVVSGGDLRLWGVEVTGGSEGLALGAGSRAELWGCVFRENGAGIKAWQDAELRAFRTHVSDHSQGGVWLWDQARAHLEEVKVEANELCGIGAAGRSRLFLVRSTLSENGWQGGLLLRDQAQVELRENRFVNNRGYGIAAQSRACLGSGPGFFGTLSGQGNTFEGNYKGPACPETLLLNLSG